MFIAQKGFIPAKPSPFKNLARYIIRASFSQDRLNYIREDYKVVKKILEYLGIYEFKRDRSVTQDVCCSRLI